MAGCIAGDPGEPLGAANVVLVTVDTLRADHLGCYGYSRQTSPNLDRLAAHALRFANAVSVSSWTLPAHASLLTGLYPAEHGVITDISALPPSAVTLANVLARGGYDTFAAVSHVYLTERWGFDRGFATFDDSAALGSPQHPVAKRIVDRGLEWLDQRQSEAKPFFMWLHIFDPHWDYAPPAPYDHLFDPDYHGTMTGTYRSLAPYIKAVVGYDRPPPINAADLKHVEALYDGEIAYVDAQLGRLFDTLDFANTLVVVTADHGEEFLEHGSLEGHQWTLYNEVVSVPLLIRAPGLDQKGRVIQELVSTVALGGTILDWIGLDNQWRDFTPLVHARVFGRRASQEVLLDLTVRRRERQQGLMTPDFKLIRHEDGRTELYRNPVASDEHDDIAKVAIPARKRLSRRMSELFDQMQPLDDIGAVRRSLNDVVRDRLKSTGYLQ